MKKIPAGYNYLNTGVLKTQFVLLLGLLLAFCLSDCKKSCFTCTYQQPGPYRWDSVVSVSYDSILHRYDTLFVKWDTINRKGTFSILHFCPKDLDYNSIVLSGHSGGAGGAPYSVYANGVYYGCGYDQ